MKHSQPSRTAAYVAVCRGLAGLLPPEARLASDPFGLLFGGRAASIAGRAALRAPAIARRLLRIQRFRPIVWMQIRTRVLDDELLRFARAGGSQVVILGAGFDCRAERFPDELAGVAVYEVDHPATQGKKRAVLARAHAESAPVRYLGWDFEHAAMAELPARLRALGHDPNRPTLVIWEGVTMYLTPPAIEATFASLAALMAPGSRLAVTYVDRAMLRRPDRRYRRLLKLLDAVGEPIRFGWDPAHLGGWLADRGFVLESDERDADLAREMLPPAYARLADERASHIAIAQRAGSSARAP
jgi:methyltransferase (TIGR00027 family)